MNNNITVFTWSKIKEDVKKKPSDYLILHDEVVMPSSKKKSYRYWKRRRAWRRFFTFLLFIVSTLLCVGLVAGLYKVWRYDFESDAKLVEFLNQFKFMKFETYGYTLCRSVLYLFMLNACNYIACFAFRYGRISKGFWFIYILSYLVAFYAFWDWNARYYANGDVQTWINMIIALEVPAIIYLLGIVFALVSIIVFYRARFKGKFDDVEEGKLSPHVFLRFILLAVTNVAYVALSIVFFIFKLIGKIIRRSAVKYTERENY